MQRLFSMFPRGLPGTALLLLRAAVVIGLLSDIYAHYHSLSMWVLAAAALTSVAVSVGYFTPIAAVAALLLRAAIWVRIGEANPPSAAVDLLIALSLALLGPGAYSLDGYRYGRRVVVLPHND